MPQTEDVVVQQGFIFCKHVFQRVELLCLAVTCPYTLLIRTTCRHPTINVDCHAFRQLVLDVVGLNLMNCEDFLLKNVVLHPPYIFFLTLLEKVLYRELHLLQLVQVMLHLIVRISLANWNPL